MTGDTAPSEDGFPADSELIAKLREGDVSALGIIVARHRAGALKIARALVDHSSADDIVSESFERLWTAVRNGTGPSDAVRPYLARVVRTCAIDLYRRRHDLPVDPMALPEGCVEDASESVTDAMLVQTALAELPERWRAVLWMYHVEDIDRHEIARRLGIKPTAVSQLLARARKGLRKSYLRQAAMTALDGDGTRADRATR